LREISFFNSAGVMRRALSPGGGCAGEVAGVEALEIFAVCSRELQAVNAISRSSKTAPTEIKRRMNNLQEKSIHRMT